MATIQIVLQAINDASRNIGEVADSLEAVSAAQEQAAESARTLTDAELAAANAAVAAISAYSELRASAHEAAVANVNAAIAAEQLTVANERGAQSAFAAATAYARLSDEQLLAANAAIAAAGGFRSEDAALLDVMRDSVLAAGGIRQMTEAELAASSAALQTALSVRTLSAAEIASVNDSLEAAAAYRAQADSAREAQAEQIRAAATAVTFGGALSALSGQISQSTAAVNTARAGYGLWGRVIHALQTQIPLWGGLLDGILPHILTQVSGWHLLADAVTETVAVWVPALAVMGIAAAGMAPTIMAISDHMKDMYTVATALGVTIPPLSDGFKNLTAEMKPAVYQLFGDALTVMSARTGTLTTAMSGLVPVLDQVGARIAIALNSSAAGTFLTTGVKDVGLLLNAFGDLFGVIGNFIKVVPGYAQILLQLGTGFLAVAENVTRVAEPILGIGMALHGFVIYVGLAVTAAVKFGGTVLGWGAALANGAASMVSLVRVLAVYVQTVGLAAAAQEAFDAVNPFVWVGLAVGALVGLVLWVNSSKSATQQWGDAMQQAEVNATSLSQGIQLVNTGLEQSTAKLATAQASYTKLAAATDTSMAGQGRAGQLIGNTNQALAAQGDKTLELAAIQQQQSADQQIYNTRVGDLAKTYGSTATAMGLLSEAGVTMAQMLNPTGAMWAQIRQEVAATAAAYSAMDLRSGELGNAMQVLDKQTTAQYSAIQKLNQGWDTQTAAMTGAMSSFDTVALGYNTMSSSAVSFTEKLGLLTVKNIPEAKAAIDSLTPSGLALNQAFSQQVGDINSLADSWRTAGVAQNMFKSGIAASIAPLEKYAAGSTDATAQLVGLAEEAGYQGPISLAALNSYLGITSGMLKNTAGDMKTMQSVAQQATVQEALLTSAMQAQGNAISSQLIGDINNAILAYHGVAAAATAYGNAIAQYGKQSTQAHTARTQLTNDLIESGKAAGDSTAQIAAMIAKVLGIPAKAAMQIVMTGTGSFSIQGNLSTGQAVPGISLGIPAGVRAAAGAYIGGGSGPRSDDVLAAVSHGELIVPNHMVAAGAVDHLRGRIPGFAGGGLVLAGNTSVLNGSYAVGNYGRFRSASISGMEQAMLSAARRGGAKFADGGVVAAAAGAPSAADAPGALLQPAIIQGFSGGLEQLHSPLILLVGAVRAQTTAIAAQTAATKTAEAATTAATAATVKPKPAAPSLPADITAEQKKIAADKANAATLAARITAVETAIKDTPAKDKAARASEESLLKTLQSALAKQDKGTGADEKTLTADIVKMNKDIGAADQKQIEAITKLLNSGTAGTSANALWAKLSADEKTMAAAETAIKAQAGGTSGGSTAAAKTATATAASASTLAEVKAKITSADATLTKLYAEEKAADAAYKAAAKGSAAKASDGAKLDKLWASIDATYKTLDALVKQRDTLEKTTSAATAPAAKSTSSSSSTSYVVDTRAEQDLTLILAQVRAENATLKQILAALTVIKAEADPSAQAKAIGPAVASAINSTAAKAAGSKTTKRG